MPKKTVKNVSNQPMYLNLPGGKSLKIPARDVAEIDAEDLEASSELGYHLSRGSLIVLDIPEPSEYPETPREVKPGKKGGR